jgi:hypothetical protein
VPTFFATIELVILMFSMYWMLCAHWSCGWNLSVQCTQTYKFNKEIGCVRRTLSFHDLHVVQIGIMFPIRSSKYLTCLFNVRHQSSPCNIPNWSVFKLRE